MSTVDTTHIGQTGLHQRTGTSAGGLSGERVIREGESKLHEIGQQAQQLMSQANLSLRDVKGTARKYPLLTTALVMMVPFLTGMLVTGGLHAVGLVGGGHSGSSWHWNKEAAQAHHALDIALDHIRYPHKYESEYGHSTVSNARSSLMNLFSGILPGGRSRSSSSSSSGGGGITGGIMGGGGKSRDMYEDIRDTGRDMYRKARGAGPSMYDKAGNLLQDTMYGVKGKIDDVVDSMKNIGERASSQYAGRGGGGVEDYLPVQKKKKSKSWLGSSSYDEDEEDENDDNMMNLRRQKSGGGGGSSWFGSNEVDDLDTATQKLRRVANRADPHQ